MKILRCLPLSQKGIYFVYEGGTKAIICDEEGKLADCRTFTSIRAPLPQRQFLHPHLDLQCLPTGQLSSPAECQQLSYDLLGNRMCVDMNTVFKQNSSKSITSFRQTSYSSPLPCHWVSPYGGCFFSLGPRRRQMEQRPSQPAACMQLECKIKLCGCKPLRFESCLVQGKADSSSLLAQTNKVSVKTHGSTQFNVRHMPGVPCEPAGL